MKKETTQVKHREHINPTFDWNNLQDRLDLDYTLIPIIETYLVKLCNNEQYKTDTKLISSYKAILNLLNYGRLTNQPVSKKAVFEKCHALKNLSGGCLLPFIDFNIMSNKRVAWEKFDNLQKHGMFEKEGHIIVYQDLIEFQYAQQIWGEENVTLVLFEDNEMFLTLREAEFKNVMNVSSMNEFITTVGVIGLKKIVGIIGNPPYSSKSLVGETKGRYISKWKDITINSLDLLADDGFLSLIHPNGWRNGDVTGKKVFDKLVNDNTMLHLNMNSLEDGIHTFNAATTFDWYIVHKNGIKTKNIDYVDVNGVSGTATTENGIIPSSDIELIQSLFAKPGEECVESLYSSSLYYISTDKSKDMSANEYMNATQVDDFIHPCVYYIGVGGKVTFWYSAKRAEFFDIPKFIMSNGASVDSHTLIDINGDYGLTQFTWAIVDEPNRLEMIYEALKSKKFQKVINATRSNHTLFNRHIISKFRKDFWKEFV